MRLSCVVFCGVFSFLAGVLAPRAVFVRVTPVAVLVRPAAVRRVRLAVRRVRLQAVTLAPVFVLVLVLVSVLVLVLVTVAVDDFVVRVCLAPVDEIRFGVVILNSHCVSSFSVVATVSTNKVPDADMLAV
jgi:hypothetical protein